jgi:putative membrane protein
MQERGQTPPLQPGPSAEDATRRTWLANERTWLAWVRTGFTATAVALGVGHVVPLLSDVDARWPYTVIGVGYALLGAALVLFGFTRRGEVERALESGGYARPSGLAMAVFAGTGAALGFATAVLVAFGP